MQIYLKNNWQNINDVSLVHEHSYHDINVQREYVNAIYGELIKRTCGDVGLNNHAVEHKCILLLYTRLLDLYGRHSIQDLAAAIDFGPAALGTLVKAILSKGEDKQLKRLYEVVKSAEWTWSHNTAFLRAMFCYAGVIPTQELLAKIYEPSDDLQLPIEHIRNAQRPDNMGQRIHGVMFGDNAPKSKDFIVD